MRKPDKARHRRRRTAEQWAAPLAEHGESGLSQRAFCRSRGLSVGAFYNAKSRAKAPALLVEERPEGEFIAVSLDPHAGFPVQARWDVELTLGPGVVLRVRSA